MPRKTGSLHKRFAKMQIKLILVAILCAAIILYLYVSASNCCNANAIPNSNIPNSNIPNSSVREFQATNLFDGGYNHTYHVNSTITGLDITLNSTLAPFMTIYGNTLLTGTGPSTGAGASFKGSVVALNTVSGKIIWRTILPNFVMSEPLIVGNDVIVEMGKSQPSYPNGIIALNINNGTVVWSTITNQTAMVMPIYINNVIYASGGEFMYLMDPQNGTVIKSFLINPEISIITWCIMIFKSFL